MKKIKFNPWVLISLCLILLLDPSNAYGLAPGILGLLLILGYMVAAFLIGSVISSFAFKNNLYRHGLTIAAALAINHLSMVYVDHNWQILDPIIETKIEFFCAKNFNHDQCVRHVNTCPRCALQIDRWKRTQMADNLIKYRSQYPVKRQPTSVSN